MGNHDDEREITDPENYRELNQALSKESWVSLYPNFLPLAALSEPDERLELTGDEHQENKKLASEAKRISNLRVLPLPIGNTCY